ncbi:MAG: glycosyltransferase family 61 protein [Sulfitobacter sp.]|nr:glycosyltransferase family 61 protein [Sulfitobacter sp.]
MRNKVDFTLPPDVLFLNPWRDPGLRLLLEPEFVWRPMPKARITGFAASEHDEVNQRIKGLIRSAAQTRTFSQAIEYNSVPALLDKASFRKSYVQARDRLVLTGAAGSRLINRFRWENEDTLADVDQRLADYFANCSAGNEGKEIPLYSSLLDPDIPFAIECRNTFNYFHFITESLCQLTALDGLGFEGDIYFHFPNQEERQQPFAEAFVEALFPEFEGRVFFERVPKDYNSVLTTYDLIGGHFQAPPSTVEGMNRFAPDAIKNHGGIQALGARSALSMNVVNSALLALRARALKAIEGGDFSHLPKKFFVGRDTRLSRVRHMEGEDKLFEHLEMFGFEYVVFESLSPLEQIAIMANAEMMVSYHGAGFTNMLFAGPQTYVIEIGTVQTALQRWGDFWPLAHASQCRYVNFFCDLKSENPLIEPDFQSEGLIPVSMSDRAIGQIMAFVVSLLGQYPELKSRAVVSELAKELLEVGGAEQAIGLLEKHKDMAAQNAELCLLKADCHKDLDEPKSELVALDMAHKADPSRWQTLVRIIWCANRCERPQVIRWALSRLKTDFPQRHDAFVSNHEWVRYVA